MNRRIIISVLGSLALLLLAYFVSGYLAAQKKPPAKITSTAKKKQVLVRQVQNRAIPTAIKGFGRVIAAQPIDLIAEVPGKIIAGQVPLKAGQSFSAGNLLFAIDEKEAHLALVAQRSSFIKLIAGILPDIKIDYPESYANWQSYFGQIEAENPLPQPPKHQSEKEKTFLAIRDVMTSYYNIKSAEARLAKYKHIAPVTGSFSEVYLEAGSYAGPNAKIAKIMASGSLEVRAAIDSKSAEFLKIGQNVLISTDEQQIKGKISRISNLLNPSTQSFDVYIDVQSPKLYDGQYVQVEIGGKTIEYAFEIERAAVFNQNQVYLVKDSLLQVYQINVLKTNPTTLIVSGLPEGSQVVSETLNNAYSQMPVSPIEK